MKRLARVLTAAALAVAGLVAAPSAAEAYPRGVPSYYNKIDYPDQGINHANLWVAPTAQLKKKGFAVTWKIAFVCPKGKRYTLDGQLGDLNPASVPPLQDGDRSIDATLNKPIHGTCTGKIQRATLQLHVRKATWPDTDFNGNFYPAGSGWYPLVPGVAETTLSIQGRGFYALYAANVGAITTAENRVIFVR